MSLVGTLRARSDTSSWEGLWKCLGTKFPGQKRVTLGEGLLLALARDLNERALILLEKDLDTALNESEEETEETGLETVELSNGEKSACFNLKAQPFYRFS